MSQSPVSYRTRLYESYLTTHVRSGGIHVREDLGRRRPYLRKLVHDWLPRDRAVRILDLGCGYGALLGVLRESGYRNATGVDTSYEQVEAARDLGLDCVEQGDLVAYLNRARDASWDVIVAFDVLEHFREDELLEIADELYRVLAPTGRLILHLPNAEAIFSGAVCFGDLTHARAFTRRSVAQLMRAAGFERVVCVEDRPVVHGVSSAARYVLWTLCRSVFRMIYLAETGDVGREIVLSQNLLAVVDKPGH